MEETKHIKISDYNYPLPDERIAKFPLKERDSSKLLVYNHGEIEERVFTSLPEYIEPGSLMIFNNTKVIQARLHFRKETGALIEIFCLEPAELPADRPFGMALYGGQSEKMERRSAAQVDDSKRQNAYTDCHTR